jgi:hypothetical protein
MKQARQVVGGAKRREGAKPCGRNVTGGLGSRRSYVAPRDWQDAVGEGTSDGAWTGEHLGAARPCGVTLVKL